VCSTAPQSFARCRRTAKPFICTWQTPPAPTVRSRLHAYERARVVPQVP
jgi:hypothetical protein